MTISSAILQEQSEASYRQIDYWSRRGFLREMTGTQKGSGHYRRFHEREIDVARLLVRLSGTDMLGSSGTTGRRADYLPDLLRYVRAHGLTDEYVVDDGFVTLNLKAVANQYRKRRSA